MEERSRRGCRFSGRAAVYEHGEIYEKVVAIVFAEERATYEVASVVLLDIERAVPLVSPGYWHVVDENEMRSSGRDRRNVFDREFESHLTLNGAFRITI